MCLSNLPGRNRALSIISILFVAPITNTPLLLLKPSILERRVFNVFSPSSFVVIFFFLLRPMESISSIKIIQRPIFVALSKSMFIFLDPNPQYIPLKSEAHAEIKGMLVSPAIAFANNVLPFPGGPTRRRPLGRRPPSESMFFLFLYKFIISATSSFTSSIPAISLRVILLSLRGLYSLFSFSPKMLKPPPVFPPKIISGLSIIRIRANVNKKWTI